MPIYGYTCKDCGHTLDALQKMSDEPLVDCPECGKAALKRQLSAPRFRLKGQGWYETDFKSDKKRNLAGDAEPAAAEAKDGKAEGKTDGKADAKADSKGDAKADKKADSGGDKSAKETKPDKAASKPAPGDKAGTA